MTRRRPDPRYLDPRNPDDAAILGEIDLAIEREAIDLAENPDELVTYLIEHGEDELLTELLARANVTYEDLLPVVRRYSTELEEDDA